MDSNSLPESRKEKIREIMAKSPELVAKFGDPFDNDDPRQWSPSKREEAGLSIEDRLHYLSLDMELSQIAIGKLLEGVTELQTQLEVIELKELVKTDPQAALKRMMQLLGDKLPVGALGPNGDNGPAYAGSAGGLAPDFIVETVNGPIRADQIPGYRNDPSWAPSPDWADANCACPSHVALREQSDKQFPNGFYL